MLRTTLDHQLAALRAAVLDTGALVTDALTRASEALLRGDHALAAGVIAADDTIDRAALRVEELGEQVIALQQPVPLGPAEIGERSSERALSISYYRAV